ncbi:MAG TPA: hypothetical protein VHF01_16145 [Candidatus Acidoferrum sp.]|nr:hypothetical protein [Candidatus Acidoferrum sp.]
MSYRLLFDEAGVTSVGIVRDGATAAETRRRYEFLERIAVPLAFLDSEIKRIEQEFRETSPEYDRLRKEREAEIEFYWLDFFRAHDDLKLMANRNVLQAALDREQLPSTPENIELAYRLEEARQTLAKRNEF